MQSENYKKFVQQWLASDLVSAADKAAIKAMSATEQALVFADKPLEFGTAGIRAITGPGTQRLNIFVYRQMATGYAYFLLKAFSERTHKKNKQPTAVITHDNRINGDVYALACAEVLAAYGIKVYLAPNNQLLATPVISYWIRKLHADGGINITASHNPKAYNGFKTYNAHGSQVLDHQGAYIIKMMPKIDQLFNLKYTPNSPLINYLPEDFLSSFYEQILKALPTNVSSEVKDLKVLFTSHHGVSSQTTKTLAHLMGYQQFVEFDLECVVTGDFPDTEITNPEDAKSFQPSEQYAQKHQFHYLMSQDPDGDRFAMGERQADGSFYYFNGNENGILFINYLQQINKIKTNPYIVASFVTTNFIDRMLKDTPVKIYRSGTGFKLICDIVEREELKSNNLLIAFEESIGALLFPFNREKDGYQTVALSLEMISYYRHQNLRLTDILQQLYVKYGHWYGKTSSFVIKSNDWKNLMRQKIDELKVYPHKMIGQHKIVKIEWNHINDCLDWILDGDNWLRFRLSGTEPKFKIYYNVYGSNHKAILADIDEMQTLLIDYLQLKQYL